jgi:phage I-like protein
MKNWIKGHVPFAVAEDGWHQIAPVGEFPYGCDGDGCPVMQVVDPDGCRAMVEAFRAAAEAPNFAGVLVDFDHLSLDTASRSEAAGWIMSLTFRESPVETAGLWAQIRWTDEGQAAMVGGRYRFVSPVWLRSDCIFLGTDAAGCSRLRPVRLYNLAVTNTPNLPGMAPLSNSGNQAAVAAAEGGEMKAVIELLTNRAWLVAGADETAAVAALALLPTPSEWAEAQVALANSRAQVEEQRLALANAAAAAAEAVLVEFAGVVQDDNKEFWRGQLLANRDGALAVLKGLAATVAAAAATAAAPVAGAGAPAAPLHNRKAVGDVQPDPAKAVALRNRAKAIAEESHISFLAAFRRAEGEMVGA